MDGTIYFQVWPGCTSSETRLVVDRHVTTKMYDCVKYENQLYKFNTVDRVSCYKHEAKGLGIDHCYDCKAEVHILTEYLKRIDKIVMFAKQRHAEFTLKERNVDELIVLVNKCLDAANRYLLITYKEVNYSIKFTDMFLGQKPSSLFKESNVVKGHDVYSRNNKNEDDDDDENGLRALKKCENTGYHKRGMEVATSGQFGNNGYRGAHGSQSSFYKIRNFYTNNYSRWNNNNNNNK